MLVFVGALQKNLLVPSRQNVDSAGIGLMGWYEPNLSGRNENCTVAEEFLSDLMGINVSNRKVPVRRACQQNQRKESCLSSL